MMNPDVTLGRIFVLGCRQIPSLGPSDFTQHRVLHPVVKLNANVPNYDNEKLLPQLTNEVLYNLDEDGASECWHHFVTLFSSFKFKHASESLYLAGLWMRNLPSDLCWWVKVIEGNCVPSRAKPYRAPTWSWASVDFEGESPCSPVVYHSNFGEKFEQSAKFCIRYAATQIAPPAVGRSVYGSVCDGLIRIRCILIAAQIFTHPYLEFDARHTIQFLEADALDEDYDPYFWPNVYLDVQGSFESIMSKLSPAANILDLPIAGDLEDKLSAMNVDVVEDKTQEDYLCSDTKVWICMVGNIVDSGICALVLKEHERANFRRFKRVGYLHNRVGAVGFENYGWHNNFMRRAERAGQIVIEIV
ncbi:putative heterokaryon incompatibility protein [Botrytis fragariae]|uniref:Putative heterokaryon incompatibility protein n=1 Tax=Botrytis fragariae TaxID=1964551 RepID=A0A8H6AV20_9HELO|nr:putative heterokaryon incompatibility protein [Botrytis fragariae]KAF5874194.1 putative heterokaryon incompatibility protein [Botrytis fragariae]